MSRKLGKLLALSRKELAIVVTAWLVLPWIDLLLRMTSLLRTIKILESATYKRRRGGSLAPARLTRLVDAAARNHVYPVRCLPRSLYLRRLLARHGWATDLRIGVTRRGRTLHAHAWIEHCGRPVGEDPRVAARFAPLRSVNARTPLQV